MKDRILNVLMLLTVAVALGITLLRGGAGEETLSPAPFLSALPAAAPTATPHPADAYRQRRAESRRQEGAEQAKGQSLPPTFRLICF